MGTFVGALAEKGLTCSDEALEEECAALASAHGLDAEDLAREYELFTVTRGTTEVTESLLEALGTDLQRRSAKRAAKRSSEALSFSRGAWDEIADPGAATLADVTNRDQPVGTPSRTPAPSKPPVGAHRTPLSAAFANRPQAGQVVSTLNAHLDLPASADAMDTDDGERAALALLPGAGGVAAGARFMAGGRLADRVALIDGRISEFGAALEHVLGKPASAPVHMVSQEEALYVGRIVDDAEGRLDARALQLEGGLAASQGHRVRLDLAQLPDFRVFPGQVVGVRGRNPTGECLVAAQLIAALPRPLSRSPVADLERYARATGAAGVSIAVAAGPFTGTEDCAYAPLEALLAWAAAARPDVLLLLGPFVDAEHPAVAGGLLPETFDALFAEQVLSHVEAYARGPGAGAHVALVPSPRDVHHDAVFPAPPLVLPPCAPINLHALPNPTTFRVNEVVVGVATPDLLKHLAGQEAVKVAQGTGAGDRMGALAAHVLGQRSYYPLYPPPPGTLLDAALGASALPLPCSPDVLLLPSDLAPFARAIGASAEGLAAMKGEPPATNAPLAHCVAERCMVEIRRV
ncbi:hypothetical protein WJX81_000373 [Elliptochloris bilobata]|uniref:DNA polymerase alpha subunit B n=1 Tax=Elliptochloris bilobata TaxID=381761 RepID=A0AAW1QVY4_9CHLO